MKSATLQSISEAVAHGYHICGSCGALGIDAVGAGDVGGKFCRCARCGRAGVLEFRPAVLPDSYSDPITMTDVP